MEIRLKDITDYSVTITWDCAKEGQLYRVYWSDRDSITVRYKKMADTKECSYTLHRSTHIPHYFKVARLSNGSEQEWSEVYRSPVKKVFQEQRETLSRGLVAIKVQKGIFLSWRLLLQEVSGYCRTGLTGTDFIVCKNGTQIARVTESTNYLDTEGTEADVYSVIPVADGIEGEACKAVSVWTQGFWDMPLKRPSGGVTPSGQRYVYHANDMSIGDVDGDGEYEYFVKWEPSNSHDVSHKGYTGSCVIDCYKLDGTLLWRLDLGKNIRAGAHYTQFMAYDFNGDGRAEMAVKTAPGTKIIKYHSDGSIAREAYITMPAKDLESGYSHESNFVCSAESYRAHLADLFQNWLEHPMVKDGQWPETLEACWGIEKEFDYPLKREEALKLADYFITQYAPSRDEKNHLEQFEGFIFEGPEYLTMFSGDGDELQTIPFPIEREDDGLMWGDYAFKRIEPCNRVDRFLSGVAYLDGERPYLIVCRGYYTRTVITAYDFFENIFHEKFRADSGHVPLRNPFCDDSAEHDHLGSDPVYGILAGQGNHSLSTADIDGDGCMEIIYGGAVIDHDGSLLYSSFDRRPDGVLTRLGHGDAMHVAKIDPDRPGMEIFNVFEGGSAVPYGFALRDAETGCVLFGQRAAEDLGRCMIGKVDLNTRGLQLWVNEMYDCKGNRLSVPLLGTNQNIRWAGDLTTQVIDGVQYIGTEQTGVINDSIHGVMLQPEDTITNNGTKGNPCLIADVFGDFREEILLRKKDDSAIRFYTNTEITSHKLFTLMHDMQYRCGVAWQNNAYNQPCYTKFYYADDMDFKDVLPTLAEEHVQ
ncbi:rhamnogalacturonan lyase family protein [Hungatella hathewayi]|uniref:rhamnogalacturonan lyase family protein n=1 Tax=Hungatella hathewayi TaxID=154046 RepID=UPI003565CB75